MTTRPAVLIAAVAAFATLLAGQAPAQDVARLRSRSGAASELRRAASATAPITALAAPAPEALPNFQVSSGASNAITAQNGPAEFGDYTGLAFHAGTYFPAWSDNCVSLPGNPDLPGSRTLEIATAPVAVGTDSASPGPVENASALSGGQWAPVIAINPTNPDNVVIVANDATGGLLKSVTVDGGANWSANIIASGEDSLDEAIADPSIAFDKYGNLFLAYLTDAPTGFLTCALALSTDGGVSFTRRSAIGSDDLEQPTVVTGPGPNGSGSVWIAYYDYTADGDSGAVAAAGAPVTGLGAVGAFTRQNAPDSSFGIYPDLAIGPNGQVLVCYQEAEAGDGPSPIISHLDANGTAAGGFGSGVAIGSTGVGWFETIPASPQRKINAEVGLAWDRSSGPASGRVYLAYAHEATAESNDTSIQLRYSDNNGASWSAPLRVDDDATGRSQFMPRIAVDQTTGNVALSWYDCRNDIGTGGGTDTDGPANTDAELWSTVIIPPVPQTIQFSAAAYTVAESSGTPTFSLTRAGSAASPAGASYTLTPGTAGAADLTLSSGTATFGAGESATTIPIPITLDNLLESAETFTVTLSNPTGGPTLGSPASAVVTITDDPGATAPSALTAVANSADSVRLSWTDNCANEDGVQIWRKLGTGDYALVFTTGPNVTERLDTGLTPGGAYTYQVRAVKDAALSDFSNEAFARINTVSLSATAYTVTEGGGAASITLNRIGDTDSVANVNLVASGGAAVSPEDFTSGTQGVAFNSGEASKTAAVSVAPDNLLEGPETFNVTLANPSSGWFIGTGASAAVTIEDDLAAPAPIELTATVTSAGSIRLDWTDRCGNEEQFAIERRIVGGSFSPRAMVAAGVVTYEDSGLTVGVAYEYRVRAVTQTLGSAYSDPALAVITTLQFAAAGAVVTEGGAVELTITRSGDTTIPAAVSYATADGTAVSPGDYAASSGTVSFGAGETTKPLTVLTAIDTLPEDSEQFQVILSGASGEGVALGAASSFTVTVSDEVVLSPPTGLTAQVVGPSSVALSWTPVGPFVTEFAVERRAGVAGAFAPLGVTGSGAAFYRDDTAVVGVAYAYRVRAAAGGLQSAPSAEAAATIPTAKAAVSPKKLNFGTVKLTSPPRKKSFKIKNTGKVALYGSVGVASGPFRVTSGAGAFSLAPRKSLTVSLEFVPAAAGAASGSVLIATTDPRQASVSITLLGRAR